MSFEIVGMPLPQFRERPGCRKWPEFHEACQTALKLCGDATKAVRIDADKAPKSKLLQGSVLRGLRTAVFHFRRLPDGVYIWTTPKDGKKGA